MGAKEERLPDRYSFGYAGQMRPLQANAGNCIVCNEVVWIDYKPASREYRETKAVHYGCQNKGHRS